MVAMRPSMDSADEHAQDAGQVVAPVGHGDGVLADLRDAARRVVRGEDVQPARGDEALAAGASLRRRAGEYSGSLTRGFR